jgi:hypothetical protein
MVAARYREELLLGTGGMAEVWRAWGPRGRVALKRLLPHAARNPSLAAAFEREGRLLSRIRHPNVVGIHEVVHDERGTCLVLEYVDGADLGAFGPTPIPENIAMRIARDVLGALETIHALCDDEGRPLGVIHRDLKPANVLIGFDGRVKLTDFGIARALSGSRATTGQNIKGTLAYLSPEQATLAPIDFRSDLFSVGALLYEMLTGTPIYDEDEPRLALARARAGDVHSLGSARPDMPLPVVELVDRALAAAPADRFPNAASMRDDLERAAERAFGLASDEELARWSAARVPPTLSAGILAGGAMTALVAPDRKKRAGVIAVIAALTAFGVWLGVRAAPAGRELRPPLSAVGEQLPRAPSLPAPLLGGSASEEPPSTATPPLRAKGAEPGSDAPPDVPIGRGKSGAASSLPKSVARAAVTRSAGRAATVSSEKGLLDLGSEPGFAYVTIDGVKAGATPLFGRPLPPGAHEIVVSREGLGSKSFTIDVRPGERVSRVVKLP